MARLIQQTVASTDGIKLNFVLKNAYNSKYNSINRPVSPPIRVNPDNSGPIMVRNTLKSLDKTDRRILNLLQDDGSMTNVELARRIELAPATTLDRVRKLRSHGYIVKFVALLDARMINRDTIAFINVSLGKHGVEHVDTFRKHVRQLPEVLECYHVSGDSDFLLKVVASDIRTIEEFLLHRLTGASEISKIHTSFVLSTVKYDTHIPVPEDAD